MVVSLGVPPSPTIVWLTPFQSKTAVPGSARFTLTVVYRRSRRYAPSGSVGGTNATNVRRPQISQDTDSTTCVPPFDGGMERLDTTRRTESVSCPVRSGL